MNEPNESGAQTHVLPEQYFSPDPLPVPPDQDGGSVGAPPSPLPATKPQQVLPPGPQAEAPAPAEPAADEPAAETPPGEEPSAKEPPAKEPPIERHDPFAWMRNAPWMNRKLSPSGRAAILLRRDLEAFPIIEGRDPNHADLDAIVKRTVDYIVPILKREQATDIVYEELEKRRAARIAGAMAVPAAGSMLKEAALRAAPVLAGAPVGVLAPALAAAVALKPTTPDDGTFDLGEELRLRTPSGSLEGEIERRVGDRWELAGVRAALNAGAGAKVLVDDAAGFANAVGAQLANRLQSQGLVDERPRQGATGGIASAIRWTAPDNLASLDALGPDSDRLPIAELRMLTKDKAGTRFGEITREEAERFCPNYKRIQAIASEAGRIARAAGPAGHLEYGQSTHDGVKRAIRDAAIVRDLLERDGVQEVHADLAIFNGERVGFRNVRGSAIIDAVERMRGGDVCVYDIKTGGARFPDKQQEKYAKQAELFFKPTGKIYVLPVYVEDMFGRDYNRR
jgi:hypothetical protein